MHGALDTGLGVPGSCPREPARLPKQTLLLFFFFTLRLFRLCVFFPESQPHLSH